MTASFNRRRRRIRSNEAAIAGVILRLMRIGNSVGDELRFFASAEAPLGPGAASGACGGVLVGVPRCRGATAAVLIGAASSPTLGQRTAQRRRRPFSAPSRPPDRLGRLPAALRATFQ